MKLYQTVFLSALFFINPVDFSYFSQLFWTFPLKQESKSFSDIAIVSLSTLVLSSPLKFVMNWLMKVKKNKSGLYPSEIPRDLKVRKVKLWVAYAIYAAIVPLNVACLVIITTNLELGVSNQIFYAVGSSYLVDFFLIQTIKAFFQAVLVVVIFKGLEDNPMSKKKKLLLKLLSEDLANKLRYSALLCYFDLTS